MVEKLLDLGANKEMQDNFGRTPLFLAITKQNIPAVKFLIQHHANLHAQLESGETVLERATAINPKIAENIKKQIAFNTYSACRYAGLPIELIKHIASFYK